MGAGRGKIRVSLKALGRLGPGGQDAADEIQVMAEKLEPRDVRYAQPQTKTPKPTGQPAWYWRANANGSTTLMLIGPKGGTLEVGTVS